jgi:hypothetical protein
MLAAIDKCSRFRGLEANAIDFATKNGLTCAKFHFVSCCQQMQMLGGPGTDRRGGGRENPVLAPELAATRSDFRHLLA